MKSVLRVKTVIVTLLIVICSIMSCDRFSKGTLSGNIKYTYRSHYDATTSKPEFQTIVPRGSGKEVILLGYNDTLIQKEKELREECSPRITTAYKQCSDKDREFQMYQIQMGSTKIIPYSCDESKSITQNCINNRNNIALSYTVQKVSTDENGAFVFPNKIPYGKYILFVTWGDKWWLVPVMINQSQTNIELTGKNAFLLDLNDNA